MTIPYPRIPPVLLRVGPFAVRWYGVMYMVGVQSIHVGTLRGSFSTLPAS